MKIVLFHIITSRLKSDDTIYREKQYGYVYIREQHRLDV